MTRAPEAGSGITWKATDPPDAVGLAAGVPTPPAGGESAPIDPGQRRALEALGYVEAD